MPVTATCAAIGATSTAVPGAMGRSRRFWLFYAGFWLLLGLALALADYQDPKIARGRAPWEPFFLEMGSVAVIGVLALAVYRWMAFLEAARFPAVVAALVHAAGATVFVLLHVGATYAIRHAAYAAAGFEYRTGDWMAVFAFEAPKDLVTYALVAGLAYAYRLRLREQAHLLQIARARSELAELRLARLSDQLHPHFLFNCLNSIAALVEENPRAAVSMIARVGDFLRASLRSDAGTLTTLQEEFDLVRDFVAIQSIRFEGALRADLRLAPGTAGFRVPRLLLQPLVENAIKHGMVRPEKPLQLVVEAVPAEDGARVTVANTRPVPAPGSAASLAGPGRGLALVRDRLALHYGTAARVEADSSDPQWFRVNVFLPPPIETGEDGEAAAT